ncbi:hypothetical protein Dimus_024828 [Dionaea muscipula]
MSEDIRALQLDSAEDNGVIGIEETKPQELEHADRIEEVFLHSKVSHQSAESVQVEPKVKEREAAIREPTEEIDDTEDENRKRHLNVVFIGHVDAGKSTTGGQILFLCGQVDDRTIQKYEKEAKDKSRESW